LFHAPRRVTGVSTAGAGFTLTLDDGIAVGARAIVVATGVQYRRLPLDRLQEFEGAGVSYAATELEARHVQGRTAVVIGGGNSAGQAAMFLSRGGASGRARCVTGRVDVGLSDRAPPQE